MKYSIGLLIYDGKWNIKYYELARTVDAGHANRC